ncbi:YihY/virulence factor BrkB family protein [Hoeflea prorocentri]|uniref:YihY/virulence factor BrkB family protein n=1 Tax=Hoeflea prorocentri TaxID=1922333 RepID=A0A9X3ZJP0_9HYPH|nr:YihY/virulence factor BrkB family protein [Hoeflea prorocentri]MCY6383654.1 YihY/virulence factor BrkB family protein [Hoeflea prorocentri]MDA5401454.1 YihY/virulence factor BrkB family protein [Hoeflea prorocentri]
MTAAYLWRVVREAVVHFNQDDGWAMASHVALSTLLAIFPFLIFATSLASFVGADAFADTAVHIVFDTWPKSIAEPISQQVLQVLTVNRGGVLTVSVLAAAFFASNGVEALRVSLNRAYRVTDRRSIFFNRAQSLGFVVIAALILLAISFLLVLAPILTKLMRDWLPWSEDLISHLDNWRLVVAVIVLFVGLIVCHRWLPAGYRSIRATLPGVLVTMIFWMAGALLFSAYLQQFSTYVATYAGLASIMIALIFLYIVAAIFILGAELNASILAEKQ